METILKKTDIKNISGNVDHDLFTRLIQDAERKNLLSILGSELYYDIIDDIEANGSKYNDVLNEHQYTYDGKKYRHLGLKRVIEDFFMAEYTEKGDVLITPGGLAQMSESMSSGSQQKLKESYLESGRVNWREIEHFLNVNSETYPLWECQLKPRMRHGSVIRMSKVDV